MDLLTSMRHFVAVVETGSFSQAAKRLGVANATVTQSIKNLEDHLGVRLINRTTRRMNLTWEGGIYEQRCRAMLADLEDIERTLAKAAAAPRGRLTVEMPAAIGQALIVPALVEFARAYPDVQTVVLLNPGSSSLVEDGIDVALQLSDLENSSLIARKVHTLRHVACASPGYIDAEGDPSHPDELQRLSCLGFYGPRTGKPLEWTFHRDGNTVSHVPAGPFHSNSSDALINVAIRDGGIVYMPDALVHRHLLSGRLVEVLSGWETLERSLFLVYPDRKNLPAKVQAFARFVEQIFENIPTETTEGA